MILYQVTNHDDIDCWHGALGPAREQFVFEKQNGNVPLYLKKYTTDLRAKELILMNLNRGGWAKDILTLETA